MTTTSEKSGISDNAWSLTQAIDRQVQPIVSSALDQAVALKLTEREGTEAVVVGLMIQAAMAFSAMNIVLERINGRGFPAGTFIEMAKRAESSARDMTTAAELIRQKGVN